VRSLVAAVQFLTQLPLAGFSPSARDQARALYWYGLVGLGIGLVLAAAEIALRPLLPLAPRLVVVLGINALVTGALHLDGLADTMDGLGGRGRDRAQALTIMRDSRIGTYGVLGLIAILALQFTMLATLAPRALSHALLLAPAWGRAALAFSAAVSRPARADGLGATFVAAARFPAAMIAMAVPAVAALALHDRAGLTSGVLAVIVALLLAAWFRRRFGGQTGDTLGSVNEIVETAAYACFVVMH